MSKGGQRRSNKQIFLDHLWSRNHTTDYRTVLFPPFLGKVSIRPLRPPRQVIMSRRRGVVGWGREWGESVEQ